MKSIAVYCGSNKGKKPVYAQKAAELGRYLAEREIEVIYGAGNVGLMGVVADSVLEAGGKITGVIPHFLRDWEVCHEGLTKLVLVDTMHERKVEMTRLSEGVIILPGGFGTLDELFEIVTLVQLEQEKQAVGLLNVDGFYDHLIAQMDKMTEEGFVNPTHRGMIYAHEDIRQLITDMEQHIFTKVEKWTN